METSFSTDEESGSSTGFPSAPSGLSSPRPAPQTPDLAIRLEQRKLEDLQDEPRSEFGAFVESTLAHWHVPGLALAVVKDGQVILSEGYGLRDIALELPVTPDTLFPIASCTKAFTAMALGILVDEGKLDWDKPVKTYLPGFMMWDAFATERMTTRDLLTHRSGLPGHDMMWYGSNFSRRELFDRLRYLEPTCDLRSAFQYQNIMYMVAGLVVEAVAGMSWERFVQSRILDPLGMKNANFSTEITQRSADYAMPYLYRDGRLRPIPFQCQAGENSGTGPAGSLHASVRDMAVWLQAHLNKGKFGGLALVSESTLDQMRAPQIFTGGSLSRSRYGYEFTSYGLGWCMRSHKGQFLLEHDGMADGFYSLVALMPRHNLGVVALSNADAYYDPAQANQAPNVIAYTLFDRLLGLEPTDWNAAMGAAYQETSDAVRRYREQVATAPRANAPASHPIECYLGDYAHPGYGVISVRQVAGRLQAVVNDKLVLPMEHCHYDIFEVYFELADARQRIAFLTGLDGHIDRVTCQMEPRVKEIVFTRVTS